jgi:hypothetical protein
MSAITALQAARAAGMHVALDGVDLLRQHKAGIVALLRTGAEDDGAKQIQKPGDVHPQVHPRLRHALARGWPASTTRTGH